MNHRAQQKSRSLFFVPVFLWIIAGDAQSVFAQDRAEVSAPSKSVDRSTLQEELLNALQAEIQKTFSGARVELHSGIQGIDPLWLEEANRNQVRLSQLTWTSLGQGKSNEWLFQLSDTSKKQTFTAGVLFAAYTLAHFSKKRILPLQTLQNEDFEVREIDLSSPQYRDQRGLVMEAREDLTQLEAKQTILEGTPIYRHAVQAVYDVKRGDALQVRLVSGEIVLTTSGVASENAYLGKAVRVTAGKNKKDLVGKVVSAQSVEVKL